MHEDWHQHVACSLPAALLLALYVQACRIVADHGVIFKLSVRTRTTAHPQESYVHV
jgi:hypothetical protein